MGLRREGLWISTFNFCRKKITHDHKWNLMSSSYFFSFVLCDFLMEPHFFTNLHFSHWAVKATQTYYDEITLQSVYIYKSFDHSPSLSREWKKTKMDGEGHRDEENFFFSEVVLQISTFFIYIYVLCGISAYFFAQGKDGVGCAIVLTTTVVMYFVCRDDWSTC